MSAQAVRATRIAMAGIRAAAISAGIEGRALVSVTYYLTVTFCNVPAALVARATDCSRQNVSNCLCNVEERRENPDFDQQLSQIENMIGGAF